MAMELWVLSDRQLNSVSEWQTAIDAEAYPLKLTSDIAFDDLRGFFPAQLHGKPTGFECYHDEVSPLISNNPDVDFGHAWAFALAFRWGSRIEELRAAWMAGTAYAHAVDGMIFDDQEGKFRNATEARQVVRDIERDVPNMDRIVDEVLRNAKLGPYRED